MTAEASGPDAYPVAYCAPGQRFAAALTLMLKGEQVARIEEHQWLELGADVIVIREPPELLFDLEALRVAPHPEPAGLLAGEMFRERLDRIIAGIPPVPLAHITCV